MRDTDVVKIRRLGDHDEVSWCVDYYIPTDDTHGLWVSLEYSEDRIYMCSSYHNQDGEQVTSNCFIVRSLLHVEKVVQLGLQKALCRLPDTKTVSYKRIGRTRSDDIRQLFYTLSAKFFNLECQRCDCPITTSLCKSEGQSYLMIIEDPNGSLVVVCESCFRNYKQDVELTDCGEDYQQTEGKTDWLSSGGEGDNS